MLVLPTKCDAGICFVACGIMISQQNLYNLETKNTFS